MGLPFDATVIKTLDVVANGSLYTVRQVRQVDLVTKEATVLTEVKQDADALGDTRWAPLKSLSDIDIAVISAALGANLGDRAHVLRDLLLKIRSDSSINLPSDLAKAIDIELAKDAS